MRRKGEVKQVLLGVPLLWLFIIVVGAGLYYFDEYPIAWLLLIFIIAPVAILIRNRVKDRKYKKNA